MNPEENNGGGTGGIDDGGGYNVPDMISDVSQSLFGNSPDSGEGGEAATKQPPEQAQQTANNAAVQKALKAMPKSWKQEMNAYWEKLDPAVHDYVYEREANFHKGFQQYQEGHNKWSSLIKPFSELMQQHPNIDPVGLMQGLMNAHLQLLSAQPAQRSELAQQFLKHYGIDLGNGQDSNNELVTLRKQVADLQSAHEASQQAAYNARYQEQLKIVKAFAENPENEFYPEVATDIAKIMKGGITSDLKEAYEIACAANPVVRQKLLAKQQASANKGQQAGQKFPNLDADGGTAPPAKKMNGGSIDQTIDSIVAKHYPTRH